MNDILYNFEGKPELKHRTIDYYKLKVAKEFVERIPDLQITYFRYLEVAMSMILPVGLLSAVLLIVAISLWGDISSASTLGLLVVGLAVGATSLLLYRNGREAYVGYQLKKADQLAALQEIGGFRASQPRPDHRASGAG